MTRVWCTCVSYHVIRHIYDLEFDMQDERREDVFEFDKFMDDIVIEERKKTTKVEDADTPQRVLLKRHRDTPKNRTRYGK